MTARAAVCLVIRDDERLLVVWNTRYLGWTLPGGMVEDTETDEEAARRELWEETRLVTTYMLSVYEADAEPTPDHPDRAGRVHVFAVFPTTYAAKRGEPFSPVTWMKRAEFLRVCPFAPFYRRMFEVLDSKEALARKAWP